MTEVIYKIVRAAEWRGAQTAGSYPGSPADLRDGFIHFSTADQLRETAAKHFSGMDDLLLVAVSTDGLDVRWEPSRGGALFPHLYGRLPFDAVRWTRPLPLGDRGEHVFPDYPYPS